MQKGNIYEYIQMGNEVAFGTGKPGFYFEYLISNVRKPQRYQLLLRHGQRCLIELLLSSCKVSKLCIWTHGFPTERAEGRDVRKSQRYSLRTINELQNPFAVFTQK